MTIVKDGEIVLKKGFGMANLEYDIPNSLSTIFHVASISKQYTVFSIFVFLGKVATTCAFVLIIPIVNQNTL